MIRYRSERRNENVDLSTQNTQNSSTRTSQTQTHTPTSQNQPQEAEFGKLVFSNQPKKNNGKKKRGANSRASKNSKRKPSTFSCHYSFWFGSSKRVSRTQPKFNNEGLHFMKPVSKRPNEVLTRSQLKNKTEKNKQRVSCKTSPRYLIRQERIKKLFN